MGEAWEQGVLVYPWAQDQCLLQDQDQILQQDQDLALDHSLLLDQEQLKKSYHGSWEWNRLSFVLKQGLRLFSTRQATMWYQWQHKLTMMHVLVSLEIIL